MSEQIPVNPPVGQESEYITPPPQVGDQPKQVLNKYQERAAPAAGVTSLSTPAGARAVAAGTALPVAGLANEEALNAGVAIDVSG